MNPLFLLVVGIFLLIISWIDIKVRAIPSLFLTGMIFFVAFIFFAINPLSIAFGILGFIMAYLLYESDFMRGVADIKIMTMISIMVVDFKWLLISILLVCIIGFLWKVMIRIIFKDEKEFAFIPVFFLEYIVLVLSGGII